MFPFFRASLYQWHVHVIFIKWLTLLGLVNLDEARDVCPLLFFLIRFPEHKEQYRNGGFRKGTLLSAPEVITSKYRANTTLLPLVEKQTHIAISLYLHLFFLT